MRRRHTAAAGGIVESGSEKGNLSINLGGNPAAGYAASGSGFAVRDHCLGIQSRGPLRGVHRGVRTVSRARLAHQRRLDGQYGAAVDSSRMALYRRWRQPPQARRHAPLARAPAAAHRDRHGDRSGHPHSRAARGQHHRSESVRQRLSAIRRRRGMPADHDRAGRIPGPLPGLRVRAGVPCRPRESLGLQHHLGRLVLPAQRLGARAQRTFAVGVCGGFRERRHSARPRRADLLRRTAGREHRGPGHPAALVLAAGRLVSRFDQGLHRALLRDPADQPPLAVCRVPLSVLRRRTVARDAPGQDRERRAAAAELLERPRCALSR